MAESRADFFAFEGLKKVLKRFLFDILVSLLLDHLLYIKYMI